MPKPIKKKTAKARKRGREEEEVKGFVTRLSGTAARGGRRLVVTAVAIVAVLVLAAGVYYFQKSQAARARQHAYEGYKLYHGLYETRLLTEEDRISRALESFQKSYDLKASPFSLLYAANSHYALGRYEEAIAALKELNRTFPDDERFVPLAYYKMAMASLKTGDADQALEYLDILANYRTDSYKDLALLEAARLLEQMGRSEEAVQKYRAITEGFPHSPFFEEASRALEPPKEG